MIKILVVDDQPIVRFATVHFIRESFPAANIDTARDVTDMVSCLLLKSYDLILLDIQMPEGNNFSMLDVIRLRQPNVKVIIFSAYDEMIYANRFISEGAHGFVSKTAFETELAGAIKTVLQGEIYISPQLKAKLEGIRTQEDKEADDANPFRSLSNRELEVLNLLIEGLSVVDISTRLNVQRSTVSTYKHRIYEKLNVSNLVELMARTREFKYY